MLNLNSKCLMSLSLCDWCRINLYQSEGYSTVDTPIHPIQNIDFISDSVIQCYCCPTILFYEYNLELNKTYIAFTILTGGPSFRTRT